MLASRKKGGAKSAKAAKMETFTSSSGSGSSSSSSGSDSDSDNEEVVSKPVPVKKAGGPAPVGKRKPAKRARRSTSGGTTHSSLTSSSSSSSDEDEKLNKKRSPSGEVTSSSRSGHPASAVSSALSNHLAEMKELKLTQSSQSQSDREEGKFRTQ